MKPRESIAGDEAGVPHRAAPYRPGKLEWLLLAAALGAATWFAAGHALLGRVDHALYDAGLALWRRPPPPDIVIVAIDEESIAALGRWPWRRGVHATLVEKLAAAGARAIALDVILAESDHGDLKGDAALVAAVAAAGNVVVPGGPAPGPTAHDLDPFDALGRVSKAIGHIHLDTDEDGVVRALPRPLPAPAPREHLAQAALRVAGRASLARPDPRGDDAQPRELIPYFGRSGTVRTYSYLAVLRGDVPRSEIEDRIVFVGTTAAGLGDMHPAPAGGRTAPLAGVEIAAQVAGSQQLGERIRVAGATSVAALSGSLALAILLLCRVLQPRASLFAAAGALLLVLAGSFLTLRMASLWIPPTAALLGIALCYPLWAWRRLEAALRYMRGELERLRAEPFALPPRDGRPRALPRDPIDATIVPLESAIAGLRDARRFIADTLESLPQALLVADGQGRVILANSRAREWISDRTSRALESAGLVAPRDSEAPDLAASLRDITPLGARTWESLLDEALSEGRVGQAEARGADGRDLLVLLSPCFRASGAAIGVIVNLVDITERRTAERRREELLRILSHDMRAPQASIITLLEMRSTQPAAVDTETLIQRVGTFARRTLDLADEFLRLARAEQASAERFVALDLVDVAAEACEEAWTLAHARSIRVVRDFTIEDAPVRGDRSLLLRMMQNLLTNAIKFSPEGSVVTVRLEAQGISWLLRVADNGPGIAREDMQRLFTRFGRVPNATGDPGGFGLGLVMVRTVVERHRGIVNVSSEPGKGAVFSVSLPAMRQEGAH